MPQIEVLLGEGEHALAVSRFEVSEQMSRPFEVALWALSSDPAIAFADIVGKGAEFRLASGYQHVLGHGSRRWQGLCSYFEQVQAEPTGVSTYFLRIVPRLWLLEQGRNSRIFQHLSIPRIVDTILSEWHIEHRWLIDESLYPVLNYRVQHGESDLDFIHRLLEEAGISYYFLDDTPRETDALDNLTSLGYDSEDVSILVLADQPQAAEARTEEPLRFIDNPSGASEQEYVTDVKLGTQLRPGKLSYRDFDFRLKPDYPLRSQAAQGDNLEARLEQYRYLPGAFRREGIGQANTPVAHDKAMVGSDEAYGARRAQRALAAERALRRHVRLQTNVSDLAPGAVFRFHHPHPELDGAALLSLEHHLHGEAQGRWEMLVEAVFADSPYAPPYATPKPRINGVQSALVVGPAGEEIHTDEYGRVRVQFHWDRHGQLDDNTSCWVRVSQGWAGAGYGLLNLPRVGQEVLVGFEEGDPDRPLVVGRVFNSATMPPYRLPEHRTKSVWRTNTSPGGGGFNEISMDDAAGRELVYIQAQRNLDQLVKNNETELTIGQRRRTVLGSLDLSYQQDKRELVANNRHLTVNGDRREQVGGSVFSTILQERHTKVGIKDALEAGKEIHIRSGMRLVIDAGARITVRGPGGFIDINADGVDICGKMVRINSGGKPAQGSGCMPLPPQPAEPAAVVDPASLCGAPQEIPGMGDIES